MVGYTGTSYEEWVLWIAFVHEQMQSPVRLIGHWIVVRSIINGPFQVQAFQWSRVNTLIQSTSLICRDFQLAHPRKRTASHRHIASCPPMVASPERHASFIYLSSFASRRVFIYFPCGLVVAPEFSSLWLRSSFGRLFFAPLAGLLADPVCSLGAKSQKPPPAI